MPSIVQQKRDYTEAILVILEQTLDTCPGISTRIALETSRALAQKLTLQELQRWYGRLSFGMPLEIWIGPRNAP